MKPRDFKKLKQELTTTIKQLQTMNQESLNSALEKQIKDHQEIMTSLTDRQKKEYGKIHDRFLTEVDIVNKLYARQAATEAERQEAERQEAERQEAERQEAERQEAERQEAEHQEAERQVAERQVAERQEAERQEAERQEAVKAMEHKVHTHMANLDLFTKLKNLNNNQMEAMKAGLELYRQLNIHQVKFKQNPLDKNAQDTCFSACKKDIQIAVTTLQKVSKAMTDKVWDCIADLTNKLRNLNNQSEAYKIGLGLHGQLHRYRVQFEQNPLDKNAQDTFFSACKGDIQIAVTTLQKKDKGFANFLISLLKRIADALGKLIGRKESFFTTEKFVSATEKFSSDMQKSLQTRSDSKPDDHSEERPSRTKSS
jgi:hypothetical protein